MEIEEVNIEGNKKFFKDTYRALFHPLKEVRKEQTKQLKKEVKNENINGTNKLRKRSN